MSLCLSFVGRKSGVFISWLQSLKYEILSLRNWRNHLCSAADRIKDANCRIVQMSNVIDFALFQGIFDDCNEFGFVRFDHDPGTQSRSALILFKSRRYPNKISQWAQNGTKGDASTRYTCVLCRRLKEKNRRSNPPVECDPPAAIVVRSGRFMVDPDYPNPPHICDFANNHLADQNEVIRRR